MFLFSTTLHEFSLEVLFHFKWIVLNKYYGDMILSTICADWGLRQEYGFVLLCMYLVLLCQKFLICHSVNQIIQRESL